MKTNQNLLGKPKRFSHRIKLCLLPLLAVLVWAGCKHQAVGTGEVGPTGVRADPVGTYALITVDGKNVPCTVQHDGHTMTIRSGSFSVNADGTCSSKMFLEGRDRAIEVKATYTQEDSKLTMKWERAGTTIGTIEGGTFTMNNEGMVFAYRK